jgi:hemerythrin
LANPVDHSLRSFRYLTPEDSPKTISLAHASTSPYVIFRTNNSKRFRNVNLLQILTHWPPRAGRLAALELLQVVTAQALLLTNFSYVLCIRSLLAQDSCNTLNFYLAEGIMASRLWTSDMTIGNDMQDADHHKLVDVIDTVIDSVNGSGDASGTVLQLWNLIGFVQQHFAEEEVVMRDWECVSLDPHVAEHKRRLQQLRDLILKVESPEGMSQLSMHYFLREWLRQHILTFDMQMRVALLSPRPDAGRHSHPWH